MYPADEFDAEVDKVIATLVSGPAVALRKTKHAINAATLTELEAALERETQGQLVAARLARLPRGRQGVPAAPAGELHRLLTAPCAPKIVGLDRRSSATIEGVSTQFDIQQPVATPAVGACSHRSGSASTAC